jgi:alcohol dehydrogenase class IV
VPCIAVPTTAGTGAEATKNAVLSRVGASGFKKSLRHDHYVPDIAVVDPLLHRSCPPEVTAASGLDAVTQLLEGFVSTEANPVTDALARVGLQSAGRWLTIAVERGDDVEARSGMALAAYLSGVVLANAGLGIIHGLASPLGAKYPIAHGVVCGTLSASATEVVMERLREQGSEAAEGALTRYAEAGALLGGRERGSVPANCGALLDTLRSWISRFGIPSLGELGVEESELGDIVASSGLKNTPVRLGAADIRRILTRRRGAT